MVVTLVANRRYYTNISEFRVGSAAGTCSYVGEPSGLGPFSIMPKDPIIEIKIPGADAVVEQNLGGYGGMARLVVRDQEAVTNLLRTIDVIGAATPAYGSTSRSAIGYICVVTQNTLIVNATDGRTTRTSSFVFTGAKIRQDPSVVFEDPGSPWTINWSYKTCVETDTP